MTIAGVLDQSFPMRRAWYTLAVFEIQQFQLGFAGVVTLLVRPIESALHVNDVTFSAITALPAGIAGTLIIYPAGLLADTFRRRNNVAMGSVLFAIGTLIAARSNSAATFFVAAIFMGLGTGIPGPSIFSAITDAFPRERRAFAISLFWSVHSIILAVALTLSSALVEATRRKGTVNLAGISLEPWQQCFLVGTAIAIVVFALVLTAPEPPRTERADQTHSSLKASLSVFGRYMRHHWLLWALLLVGISFGYTSAYALMTWAPAFGQRHFGVAGVSAIGLMASFRATGLVLGSIVGGSLGQLAINHGNSRFLPRMLAAACVVICVFSVVTPFLPSWSLTVIGIAGVHFATIILGMLVQIAIQETAPNETRGQLVGLWIVMLLLPETVGATLVAFLSSGLLAKAGGLGPAFAVVGGVTTVIGALLFVLATTRYERARVELKAQRAAA